MIRKTITHFRVNRCDMKTVVAVALQYCDITKPNDPFWFLYEVPEVQLVDNPYTAITTSCTHNGTNRRIVEHFLHVRKPFSIRPSKNKIPRAHGLAYTQIETPTLHGLNGGLKFGQLHKTCRAGNANGIPRFQVRWNAPGYII